MNWRLLTFLSACISAAFAHSAPQVKISNGTLQGGKCSSTNVNYFLSIPFAKPPVGELRFASPQPFDEVFDGIRDATQPAPACMQFGTAFVENGPQSEDCLFLDIWMPANATDPLPVKVWLFGGSDAAGGISNGLYDGCISAADSIQVNVNYRVGPLGWLAVEAAGLSGNYGLQDQLLALRWVQENIAAFGGDKSKVMLFGQSAGAFDTFVLTTLPEAPSLMSAAILESGAGADFPTLAESKKFYESYVARLNCNVSDVKCLQSKTPEEFNSTFLSLPNNPPDANSLLANFGRGSPWGPVIDGSIIPGQPIHEGIKVPSIIGTTSNDGALLVLGDYLPKMNNLTEVDYELFLAADFGPFASTINSTFPLSKFAASPLPVFTAISTIVTQYQFLCPSYRALLTAQSEVYTYSFNHTPSCSWLSVLPQAALPLVGATHTAELPFVFGLVNSLPGNCSFTPAERQMSEFIRNAWTNMAATGNPGVDWPRFTSKNSAGMIFNDSPAVGHVDYSICAFWDNIDTSVSQLAENQTAAGNASQTDFGNSTSETNNTVRETANLILALALLIGSYFF